MKKLIHKHLQRIKKKIIALKLVMLVERLRIMRLHNRITKKGSLLAYNGQFFRKWQKKNITTIEKFVLN